VNITVVSIGRPSRLLGASIEEYETRAGRYWKLDTIEVKGERAGHRPVSEVRAVEGDRLRSAVPDGCELVALTRAGEPWTSERLAKYLNDMAVGGFAGAAFVIGGAYGLDRQLVRDARHRVSLSPMTLPHDLARLVFAEQLYRAGTIVRGEPYHKG
jgi:23S rRNA (pseudouridine1915-N3)-methyltransferase